MTLSWVHAGQRKYLPFVVELRDLGCHDLRELRQELRLATARLRRKRTVLQGCFTQCGYVV